MASKSNHRKLILASLELGQCDFFCNPKNIDGFCPPTCLDQCPYVCYRPIPSFIPPPPPPPPPPPSNSSQFKILRLPLPLLITLSVLVLISSLLLCYTLYKAYKNWVDLVNSRRRRAPEEQQEETHDHFLDPDQGPMVDHPVWYIRTVGLQSSVINSIAICKYKRGDGLVEGTECSVCLNEFQEDETLRLLPKCNHAFHIPCIDTWLRSHTNCPLCRAGIVGGGAGVPTTVPGQSVDNPARVREENQVVVSETGGEFRREREDGELIGIEEEGEIEVENREKSLEIPEEDVVHQPKRRSMSVDSAYVSITNAYQGEIAGSSSSHTRKPKESVVVDIVPKRVDVDRSLLKLVGGSLIGRSSQKGPISMERSMSSSGKG